MNNLRRRFPKYSRLLKLYPPTYRKQYEDQMLMTLNDMLNDKQNNHAAVWVRTVLDFPLSVTRQNLTYMGDIMTHQTPNYVKRSSLAGVMLLIPFFIFVVSDTLTSHSVYSGWFWKPWVVGTWLIIMPALAFVICSTAFFRWSADRQRQQHTSFWQSLFDWRRNWSMLSVVALSLGIIALAFGHDSVHCVVHNPIKEIRYWHTTLRCIQNG